MRLGALLLVAGALVACQLRPQAQELPVRVLLQGAQCGDLQPGVRVLSAAQVQQTWQRLRSDEVALPMDWARERLVAVSMGQRPSAGYGLALRAPVAHRQGEVVALPVAQVHPAPGAITAQVVTVPCLWVALPKGDYRTIQVVGPDGGVFAVTAVEG